MTVVRAPGQLEPGHWHGRESESVPGPGLDDDPSRSVTVIDRDSDGVVGHWPRHGTEIIESWIRGGLTLALHTLRLHGRRGRFRAKAPAGITANLPRNHES